MGRLMEKRGWQFGDRFTLDGETYMFLFDGNELGMAAKAEEDGELLYLVRSTVKDWKPVLPDDGPFYEADEPES